MAPKHPPHWDLYRDQMSLYQSESGHALWQTIPVADSKRIQPGDVGYVRKGRFHLLFSASLSPDKACDVPQSFEILNVRKIHLHPPYLLRRLNPLPALRSDSRGGEGALLLTKYPTYRENVERVGDFEEYIRKHYDSWVEFARQNGHGGGGDLNPVLVTGVDRTRDFVMLCYSKDDEDVLDCEFTTPIPGVTDYGKWNKTGLVHTNHGPQTLRSPLPTDPTQATVPTQATDPTQTMDPTSSRNSDPEPISDQFFWIPRVIKASAGPHELGGGRYDDDGSPLEAPRGSDPDPDPETPPSLSDGDGCSAISLDTESNAVVHNIRAGGRDDFDVIADYVFQNSNAESVLLHHKDIALLRKLGSSTDLSTLVFEARPSIVVDTDGVGTIKPETDLSAGTWYGGVMAPTISSVPSGNRQQAANTMAPLEPQPSSHYQQNIPDSAQESTTDASDPVSKSIAPVFGDPMPNWSHTGPQLSGAFPNHSHGFRDGNIMGLLNTEGKGKQASLPMESPPGQVGPQKQDKMEQAMTPDEESDVDSPYRGGVHRGKSQQGAMVDSRKDKKPPEIKSVPPFVKDPVNGQSQIPESQRMT
ncbi:hypothetical protein BJ322DRAFT_1020835 [Thelephora terrestris]|uniref:Uncharacterized protein n=1 Tax=Thelephora terrestris TaxID=56493 RepID=A0A9P6L774_9AGAM|nr:hypothetical protein BJ322DRAFT_1020835 [Thelephora terrestris]